MAEQQPSQEQPLDELMLAMDVVDTLRHSDRLVDKELNQEERDWRLTERLRQIYASQGIEVSDRILAEGVAALREERFKYQPPEPSLTVRLAHLYVDRGKWGKTALGVAGVLLALVIAYQGFLLYQAEQREALAAEAQAAWQNILKSAPTAEVRAVGEAIYARAQTSLERGDAKEARVGLAQIEALQRLQAGREAIVAEAKEDEAVSQAEQDLAAGLTALRGGDATVAEAALSRLQALQTRLGQEYVLRIVSRPNEPSGVWRVPDRNPLARNYYLIVEAVTPAGDVLTLPITGEENGETANVDKWGLRVSEATFERIRADKQDDGIIQNSRVAVKSRGFLEPEYLIPALGGAITSW